MASLKPAVVSDGAVPKVKFREPQIEMAHGAGGIASRRLVEGLFAPLLFRSARLAGRDHADRDAPGWLDVYLKRRGAAQPGRWRCRRVALLDSGLDEAV